MRSMLFRRLIEASVPFCTNKRAGPGAHIALKLKRNVSK
jgi:hypothetical protein